MKVWFKEMSQSTFTSVWTTLSVKALHYNPVSACLCCSVSVLSAQSVSQCVCRGEACGQLEWVLLDAHFALLQRIIQQGECQAKAGNEKRFLVAKRCQALTALICLTSITPCQELLDMQERVRVIIWARNIQNMYCICIFLVCSYFSVLQSRQYRISLPVFWVAIQWSTIFSPYIDCYVCKCVMWPRN